MELKEKMKKFNQRWNVTSDKNYQTEFQDFRIRVLNIFWKEIDKLFQPDSVILFCQFFGISKNYRAIQDHFELISSELAFYRCIEVIFSLDFRPENVWIMRSWKEIKILYLHKFIEALDLSSVNLSVNASMDNGIINIILYPKWEDLLDTEIINKALSFLDENANQHFHDALNFQLAKNWIKVGESIRRALEEFLKFKLNNDKWLKANITEVGKVLKTSNSPSQTRNIIIQNFSYLDDYFNDHTKHNDWNLDEYDAEFLIYQAGLLMRYISKSIN